MKPECLTRAVLAALFASQGALAQSSWVQQSPVTHPGPLIVPAMAYDALHQQVVLFSGTSSNGNVATTPNDTWLWNGSPGTWTLAAPAHKPAGRVSGGIAWDELHQQVVIFGGGVSNTTFGDTWVWDGNDWTQKSPATSPPARQGFSMAYDAAHQQVVLFGGLGSTSNLLNDTWTWDGSTWTHQLPALSPSARIYHQMAFDSARQQVVLFGGQSFTLGQFSDTWIWNGTNWAQQAPAVQPPALRFHAMVYDSALLQTVIFGGVDALGPTAATWLWDGVNWSQFTGSTPSPRYDVGMAYDAANQQAVIFGGDTGGSPPIVSETWTFGDVQPVVNITVPAGVQFTFNGQTYTGSQSIGIAAGSYTLSTTSPQAIAPGTQSVFTSWSDGGAQTHAVVVGASNVNITGAFTTQYLLTTSASPVNGGTVTQTGAVSNGPYYDAGSIVSVFETPAPGYAFSGWSGACNGTGACFVTMNSPAAVTGNFAHPTYPVTINVPPGIQFSLGGFPLTGSTTIQLPAGDYGLSTASPQATSIGTQAVFLSWSDGGAQAHTLTVSSAAVTVTGTFKTQYLLTTNASPAPEGAVSPASGYYDAGSPVSPVAGAGDGFEFEYWSGGGCTGSNPFCFLVMSAPKTLTANFSTPFQWVPLFPATSPNDNPEANGGTLVYDAARQQIVLFDSTGAEDEISSKTWVWDGVTWTQKFPVHSPPPRNSYAIAYDAARSQVVLFGGLLAIGTQYSDTWTWDGSDWTQQAPAVSPSNRASASMVYDPVHQRVLLFGGVYDPPGTEDFHPVADTWTWDGINWTQQNPATSPSARSSYAMAYDAARQEVVLYGGENKGSFFDTWTWDGSTWTQKAPVSVPDLGVGGMAYDPLNQQIVLASDSDSPRTWLWDGTNWVSNPYFAFPASRNLAYDAARGQIVAGINTPTWIFTNVPHARYLLTASASPNAGGAVTMSGVDQAGPSYYSGTPVQVVATPAPGYIFTGWGGDCSGAPATCTVTMNADRTATATFSNGPVNVTVNVPAGIQFTLNGTSYTGTQTIPLPPGSYPLSIASPQSAGAGTQVVFSSWSDGGAQAHQITVAGPTSVTAAFRTQYALTTNASPIQGGIVFAVGQPWYDSGTNVAVIQIPTQGYTFANWSGACSGSGSCSVAMNAPETVTANYNAPKFNLTISVPAGVQYSLFGFPLTGTQTLSLPPGNYPISINSPQASAVGTLSVFLAWSDGGAATHTIILGAANLTVTGTFKTQYLLTTTATPAAEGSVAGGGYYDAGAAVPVVAVAAKGYALQYWSGGCSGSANCFLFMNGPESVTANFSPPQAWVELFPVTSPGNVFGAMVYDSTRQQLMSFLSPGFSAPDSASETWVFDGANWILKSPAHKPSQRGNPEMAFDRANAQSVLFGGQDNIALSETWIWDGNDWTQKIPVHHPAGRAWQAMAYDAARGQTVLFGGVDEDQMIIYGDTWVWDGADWTQKAPAHAPPARFSQAMAYDATRQTVVMFGGANSTLEASPMNDTWLWNGTDWAQQSPATVPPARAYSELMAYDPTHRQTLLFGGAGRDDTWVWDGTNWLQQTPPVSPESSQYPTMAYDELHQQAVLFTSELDHGGVQTWAWEVPSVNLVPQAPTAVNDGLGNYLVTVTLKNQGNVPLTNLFVTSAKLGNVAAAGFTAAFIAAIEPGATGSFTARFPIASIAGKNVPVTFQGTYSAGSVVAAPWTANARQIVLP
jgi:uncharacterized repeat protein (TIGR02543 family)